MTPSASGSIGTVAQRNSTQSSAAIAATSRAAIAAVGLLVTLAVRRDEMRPDMQLGRIAASVAVASCALALFALIGPAFGALMFRHLARFAIEAIFIFTASVGAGIYAGTLVLALRLHGVELPLPRRFAPRAKAGGKAAHLAA